MKRDHIERDIIQVLRKSSLGGSEREISLHDPLGELGLGLDSLALVEFVTAIEKRFHLQISEEIWTDRGKLTLDHLINVIVSSTAVATPGPQRQPQRTRPVETSAVARPHDAAGILHLPVQGDIKRWPVIHLLLKIMYFICNREKYFILEYKLREQPLPNYSSPLGLALREASTQDTAALTAFWKSFEYRTFDNKKMDIELFSQRLESGATCLIALHGDRIVGIDWLLERGYDCPYSGLRFTWARDTCYGGELYEHKDFQGCGVGLELLAFSIEVAKNKGFHRQVTWVTAKNVKMLSAAMQLFNFQIAGQIQITRILGRPFSTWSIGSRSGIGGTAIF
jgi:acyl carrier protein/GNAT superfamily N-acetyltransferase